MSEHSSREERSSDEEEQLPRRRSARLKNAVESAVGLGVVSVIVGIIVWVVMYLNTVNVDAGDELVLIKQPLFIGRQGVDPVAYPSGRVYMAPTTTSVVVNVQPQQFELAFKDMMTSDGVPVDFHAALRIQVTDSVTLIHDFGKDWYAKNVQIEFQNQIRQAVRQHGMNEVAISTTAVDAINAEVMKGMIAYVAKAKLPLLVIDVTMGRANPPDAIKTQRIETANQEQRQNTEKQRKLAEDQRKLAEESRADADNAYRNKLGLDAAQFIQLEQVHMMERTCGPHVEDSVQTGDKNKDGGSTSVVRRDFMVPCTFIVGNSNSANPLLTVPAK